MRIYDQQQTYEFPTASLWKCYLKLKFCCTFYIYENVFHADSEYINPNIVFLVGIEL